MMNDIRIIREIFLLEVEKNPEWWEWKDNK